MTDRINGGREQRIFVPGQPRAFSELTPLQKTHHLAMRSDAQADAIKTLTEGISDMPCWLGAIVRALEKRMGLKAGKLVEEVSRELVAMRRETAEDLERCRISKSVDDARSLPARVLCGSDYPGTRRLELEGDGSGGGA